MTTQEEIVTKLKEKGYIVLKNISEDGFVNYKDVPHCGKCRWVNGHFGDLLIHIWTNHEIKPKELQAQSQSYLKKEGLI